MRALSVVLLAAGVWACSGLRQAAHFDGRPEPAITTAHGVQEVAALPPGHESLGPVRADCTLTQGARALHGEWLSDVDCSQSRLRQALREKTAEVGGALVVGAKCHSRKQSSGAVRVVCSGEVARPLKPAPSTTVAEADQAAPPATEAWRIRVHFTPSSAAARSPRRVDQVRELPRMPVSHVPLGDVVTRCQSGCSQAGAHEGVRYAAARMGASDVVGVHCSRKGEGWLCSGTAAAYEVDPGSDPNAR